jgi:hypothetical protein
MSDALVVTPLLGVVERWACIPDPSLKALLSVQRVYRGAAAADRGLFANEKKMKRFARSWFVICCSLLAAGWAMAPHYGNEFVSIT